MEKNSGEAIQHIIGGDKRVHAFCNRSCLKLNVVERKEFELAYFDTLVQHFSFYTTGTQPIYRIINLKYVILRTDAVVELQRPQGWRTREHISCHQSLGTWVWRSKTSRTSLVLAEWFVEFKHDFNIITRELSRATLLFSLVIIEPSGTFELIHQIAM